MIEFDESPFDEPLGDWSIPEDESPNSDTLDLLCRIFSDGTQTRSEVLILAYYLNDTPGAIDSWPGNRLIEELQRMFESGDIHHTDVARMSKILNRLEKQFSRGVSLSVGAESSYGVATPQGGEISFPAIGVQVEVPDEDDNTVYQVDLANSSCTCDSWDKARSRFPEGDLRRACVHVAQAYEYQLQEHQNRSVTKLLGEVLADHVYRQRGLDHRSEWSLLKIRMRPYIVARGEKWCFIHGYDRGMNYSRYAFNLFDHRWAFANVPRESRVLSEYLASSVGNGRA